MSTKKIILFSIFFALAGFFLTGYVFADEDRTIQSLEEIEKLQEEQQILLEKVTELENALNDKENNDREEPADSEENLENLEEEVPSVPGSNKVLVAYVKDEYNAVNTRADIGTNYPVVERVSQKSPMVVLETKDEWYRVKLESGNIAWVASWVVRVQEE